MTPDTHGPQDHDNPPALAATVERELAFAFVTTPGWWEYDAGGSPILPSGDTDSAPCHCDGDEFCRQCHPALVPAGYCCESLWRVGTCTCPDREQEVGW